MSQLILFFFVNQVIFAFIVLTILIYAFNKYILPRLLYIYTTHKKVIKNKVKVLNNDINKTCEFLEITLVEKIIIRINTVKIITIFLIRPLIKKLLDILQEILQQLGYSIEAVPENIIYYISVLVGFIMLLGIFEFELLNWIKSLKPNLGIMEYLINYIKTNKIQATIKSIGPGVLTNIKCVDKEGRILGPDGSLLGEENKGNIYEYYIQDEVIIRSDGFKHGFYDKDWGIASEEMPKGSNYTNKCKVHNTKVEIVNNKINYLRDWAAHLKNNYTFEFIVCPNYRINNEQINIAINHINEHMKVYDQLNELITRYNNYYNHIKIKKPYLPLVLPPLNVEADRDLIRSLENLEQHLKIQKDNSNLSS